jgi:DNA-binding transcriptional ArsR family regulator
MARPSPTRPSHAPATSARPAGPAVRDYRGTGAAYRLEWDVRPVYDFLISLSDDAGGTDDLPAADRRWLADARAALPERIRKDRDELLGSELCIQVADLVVDRPEAVDADGFIAALERLPTREVVRYLEGESVRDPEVSALIDRALAGEEAAFTELGPKLGEHNLAQRLAILRDPEPVVERLVGVFRAWREPFATIEPRVRAMIQHDFEARAGDIASLPPTELIEKTTGGLRWLPEPGINRVILAPSYFARPFNYLFSHADWRVYAYPIADAAIDAADPFEPPPAVVRLHRALGDPSRLRILRLLADGDKYLTELAGAMELSKPTVKHHMALLRAAGLVTLIEEGSLTYFSLRRDRLAEIGTEINHFITP